MKVIIDTREQRPWGFPEEVKTEIGALQSGDYSLSGLTDLVAVERKELSDLTGCITSGRDRFKRELQRLRGYRCKAVIIEASMSDIINGQYRSKVNPESVIGSIASWQTRYNVPFVFAGDHQGAMRYCLALFRNYLKQLHEYTKAIDLQALK